MSTSFILELHPDVESDYSQAYHWYEMQQKGLGDRFLLSVRKKLELVQSFPETYSEKTKKSYREAIVDVFPYIIVYRVYRKQKKIFVSSIHHVKMQPARKYRKA